MSEDVHTHAKQFHQQEDNNGCTSPVDLLDVCVYTVIHFSELFLLTDLFSRFPLLKHWLSPRRLSSILDVAIELCCNE